MNVGQLIEALKNYDPNLPVISAGYEGGYNDIQTFELMNIVRDYHTKWYYGNHESTNMMYGEKSEKLKETAVAALRIG